MIKEDQGFIFEVGFNIGILAYLRQHNLASAWVDFYQQDLEKLKFRPILDNLITRVNAISTLNQQIVENWSQSILLRGFLNGLNFFGEYLQSIGWDVAHKLQKIEVLYLGCRFSDENSINTYNLGTDSAHYNKILSHFGKISKIIEENKIPIYVSRYKERGEFLKADIIMLLRYKQEYRILAIDTSIFSLSTEQDFTNLEFAKLIKRQLIREINYLRSKSVFSHLRIDTGEKTEIDLSFPLGLQQYFKAFTYEDKESSKLIQAGSYAYSFWQFLQQETTILADAKKVSISVIGNSDRSLSSMTVAAENISLLQTCHEIYKNNSSKEDINEARHKLLSLIKRQAYRSFQDGRKFVDSLLQIPSNEITVITHQEKIEDFFNTVGEIPADLATELNLPSGLDLRNAHASLIKKALLSQATYLFLNGNPGIGKTTAIASFLQENIDEGFLFLYVSPRKQVNLDIIDKFKNPESGKMSDDRIFSINTNFRVNQNTFTNHTVQYLSNRHQGDFEQQTVIFRDAANQEINYQIQTNSRLRRQTEVSLTDTNQVTPGVIASICHAIYALIKENTSNQILASICIQSLKKTRSGDDTLKHFKEIFKDAYNSHNGKVLPHKMREISSRIKHLFIMIDEITGDDSGVEFLNRISQLVQEYQLADGSHGFNTKIIVADASIVDKDVITQHLNDSSPEPNKIYFRKAKQAGKPLTWDEFEFKKRQAIAINANSYPASSLSISYKIVVNSSEFQEEKGLKNPVNDLIKAVDKEILRDIFKLIKQNIQVLVYIQDKDRLQRLIEQLQKEEFKKNQDYLEIHANVSEKERQNIQKYKNQVKVILMTSSGSRGLSFPLVKAILVDIPRFQIEANLMEIIQVIYRGRGILEEDKKDKQLIFYLAEKAIYYPDKDSQLSLQESLLNILNILLLLKASIMTRIKGVGNIGKEDCLIIPIGGKSVTTVGDNFSTRIANLLRELRQQYRLDQSDRLLKKSHDQLKEFLGQADFIINPSQKDSPLSYLSIIQNFESDFQSAINKGFDKLLNLGKLETAYICGSLLIIPTAANLIEENYGIQLDKISYLSQDLINNFLAISKDNKYPENLRLSCQNVIDLIDKVKSSEKSQRIEQFSQSLDCYYALPLFSFLNATVLKEYLTTETDDDDDYFRQILQAYILSLYPVDNVLPIGHRYKDFPFLVFTSYSLAEMRLQMFTNKYILNSNELNILNLILSQQ